MHIFAVKLSCLQLQRCCNINTERGENITSNELHPELVFPCSQKLKKQACDKYKLILRTFDSVNNFQMHYTWHVRQPIV